MKRISYFKQNIVECIDSYVFIYLLAAIRSHQKSVWGFSDCEGDNKSKRGIFTTFLSQRFIVEATQYF